MNNLAAKCQDCFKGYGKRNLLFVNEVYGRLYVESKGLFYIIEQYGERVTVTEQSGETINFSVEINEKLDKKDKSKLLRNLFYSLVVDYSAYSWNIDDYRSEWKNYGNSDLDRQNSCWIDSLFHKNDSYQTPIVLNPFRNHGNINFNNERSLLKDRLLLILQMNNSVDSILLQKHAESLVVDTHVDYSPTRKCVLSSSRLIEQMVDSKIVSTSYMSYLDECESIGKRLLQLWNEKYSVDFIQMLNERDDNDVCRALNYIVYKTIKIAQTYSPYRPYINAFKRLADYKQQREYINLLSRDNTHVTLKL